MTNVGELQDLAEQRRERLKALRGGNTDKQELRKDESVNSLPTPVFRSYKPKDETLKELQIDQGKTTEVKSLVSEQLEASTKNEMVDQVDLNNLAPRKADWDLKRDISKKLETLEKLTKKAIAEIIRNTIRDEKPDIAEIAKTSKLVDNQ